MAMVHGQNKKDHGIGGHIARTRRWPRCWRRVHHFFHAKYGDQPGDFVYFQGAREPSIYARRFCWEARRATVLNFRL